MTEAGTTVYRGCDWVVAWDGQAKSHVYLRGADLAFAGNEVTFVGPGYDGPADREVPGAGLMLIPGLVNIHSHPAHCFDLSSATRTQARLRSDRLRFRVWSAASTLPSQLGGTNPRSRRSKSST